MTGSTRREQGLNARALEKMGKDLERVVAAVLEIRGAPEAILARSGTRVVNNVKRLIQQSGRGTNPRGGKRAGPRDHVPSAPGQPPATDTGRLVQSYDYRVGRDTLGIFVEIGSNLKYAPPLEIGTRHMKARPALTPALTMERDQLILDMRMMVETAQRAAVAQMPKTQELG